MNKEYLIKTQDEQALIGYVPVISKPYLEFIEKYSNQSGNFFVADKSITDGIRGIKKDLRALEPETSAQIIEKLFPEIAVRTIGKVAVAEQRDKNTKIVMPDDEISRKLVTELNILPNQYELLPIFLRWNRDNINVNQDVVASKTINIDEIDPKIIDELNRNVLLSNDWWRQIAAVVRYPSGEIWGTHNMYVPQQYTAEIDGDMRSQLKRGVAEDMDYYNSVHDIARIVANSASGANHSLKNSEIYTTAFPCPNCSKLSVESGIKKIYYIGGYAVADGQSILDNAGVDTVKIDDPESRVLKTNPNLIAKTYPD